MSTTAPPAPWHQRVFRNTVVNGAAMMLAAAVGFVLTPFLIRHLGASGYGLWSLIGAFSVSAGYLSLADLGIQQTTVKLVAEHEARAEWREVGNILKVSLWLFLGLGLALGAAMAVFTVFFLDRAFHIPIRLHDDVHRAFLLFSIQIPIELCTLPFAGVIQGRQRYSVVRGAEIVRTAVWVTVAVIALRRGGGLATLSAANLLGATVALGITGFAAVRLLPHGTLAKGRSSLATLRRILSFSANVLITQVTGVLYRQMDRIIIAAALTSVALARYEIASKLQALAALFLGFTVSAALPAASVLSVTQGGRERLKDMFLQGTKYSCAVVLPVTIALMIWADDLVLAWVGPRFSSSADYARWFLAWVIPAAATSLGWTMMVGLGHAREVMYIGLASALINLALSIALVKPLGVLGVIIGTLVGYTLVWYPYMRLFMRVLDVRWSEFARRTALPIVAVCLPWSLVVFLAHLAYHATTLGAACGAIVVSVAVGWGAIFFLALRSEERQLLIANTRALVG